MSLRQNNNVTSVILSDVTKATSTLPSVGTTVTSANLEKGAVVMVDAGLERTTLSSLADGDRFMIVQGKGTGKQLMKSPILTKGKTKITIAPHKPAVQQVTTIGYNGTTGSLPAANNTSYFIKLRKNDNDAANRSQPMSLFAQYKTDATGTQEELALGLAKNFNKNFADEPANGYAKIEVLCDEAGTEALGAADTIVAVKGSREVTIVETGGVLPYLFVVGDFIRFGTATTAQVYKITATTVTVANGGVLTLDRPATVDYAPTAGTGTTVYITAAQAAAAEFGLVITGLEAPFDVNKFRNYYTNRFTATFSDPTTLVSHTQGARDGNGVWQQVALDEYMSYGFEGQNEMLSVPPTYRDQEVKIPGVGSETALTSKYSAINIKWEEITQGGVVSVIPAQGLVLIYLNLENSGGSGILDTGTANTGETLAAALGLSPADLDE